MEVFAIFLALCICAAALYWVVTGSDTDLRE